MGKTSFDFQMQIATYSILTALASLIMVFGRLNLKNPSQEAAAPYLTMFMAITALVMMGLLISETATLLVSPVEGLVLAQYPINGQTYVAAKLSHLARILVYGVIALNTIPAFALLLLNEVRWFYPINHLVATFAVGLVEAALTCSIFGILIRFLPAARLRAIGHAVQFLPVVILGTISVADRLPIQISIPESVPLFWPAQLFLSGHGIERSALSAPVLASAGAIALVMIFGIRSLSADYLVRVASISHGGSANPMKSRRSRLAEVVTLFCGSPASRGGFEFVRSMMLRDWEFKRRAIMVLPIMATPLSMLIRVPLIPFSEKFSWIHFLPHTFGFMLFWICLLLPYGSQERARWILETLPDDALRQFIRGMYVSLWLHLVLFPHGLVLLVLAWLWGVSAAALFVCFSAALSSLYLACELRLISGIPFMTTAAVTSHDLLFLLSVGAGIAAVATAIQHTLVFRSYALVVGFTAATAFAGHKLTLSSLNFLEERFRSSLRNPSIG